MLLAQYYNNNCEQEVDKVEVKGLHCSRCRAELADAAQTVEKGGRFGCKNCLETLKKLEKEDLKKSKKR